MQIAMCGDSANWDATILELGGSLYQSWDWGELREGEGWAAWRIVGKDGCKVRAAVQILERRLPVVGLGIMYAPRGIVTAPGDYDAIRELTKWLYEFVRKRRAIALRIDPTILDSDESTKDVLRRIGYRWLSEEQWSVWNRPRAIMKVDISLGEDDILNNMRKEHRYCIRRALRDGLTVEINDDLSSLHDFYPLLVKTGQRQQIIVRGIDHFIELHRKFVSGGKGVIAIARENGRALAAIVCTRLGKTCYYLNGGFDWEYRDRRPNQMLHWKVIQWARQTGCTEYDLAGANTKYPPSEQRSSGVYEFKKGFGAGLRYYAGYFDLVGYPALYSLFRVAERHAGDAAYIAGKLRAATSAAKRKVSVLEESSDAAPVSRATVVPRGEA
ncbi:MAG: peptidoglycan bridge formation glycyltransferase FemA/FemB family protein [Candidatus Sulfotelmatobacter sp.]